MTTRRLRLCLLTTFYPPYNFGGDGIGIQRFAKALVRRGHHVTVVHDVDAFQVLHRGPEPEATIETDGVEVVRLRSRLGVLSPLVTHQTGRPLANGRALRAIVDRGRFDVLHFNNISLVGGPGLLSLGTGVKIYEAHEHWLVCASHVLWRHNREPCTGRQCLRCVLRFKRLPQLWRYTGLLDRKLKAIDTFIAKSEFSRAKHREFGFPHEMEVVPYFLPELEPAPVPETTPPQARPYFLFVGRLEPIKGLDDVVPLFRDFERADLLIAGDGTHAEALRRSAAGNPRVRFLGRVGSEELARLYRHARALIVPSVGYETFGIILIEAMRQGTPVLARRIGPFPEIVSRGGGLLFDDAADLRVNMDRLFDETDLRSELSRSGVRAFREHWSEPVVVPRYLDLIRRAAERRGATAVAAAAALGSAA
jgi:glycosyltransferase involved in cell wall biosynthesis